MNYLESTARRFVALAPTADYWSLRLVEDAFEHLEVRQGVTEPCALGSGRGAMITLGRGGGAGSAATSDLSDAGLRAACARAGDWAEAQARLGLFDAALYPRSAARIEYASPVAEPWDALPFSAKLDVLQAACAALEIDERIVDWSAWLGYWHRTRLLTTSDGGRILQNLTFTEPGLLAVANAGSQTQHRHGGGADWSQQGGLERLAACGLREDGRRVAEEALALPERSPMRGLTASSCHTYSIAALLLSRMEPAAGIASLKHEIGLPNPARPGDRLTLTMTCVEKRISASRPDRGLITFDGVLANQEGVPVLTLRSLMMVKTRPVP